MKIVFKQGQLHAMALDEDTVALVMSREQAQTLYERTKMLEGCELVRRALGSLEIITKPEYE